VRLRSRSGMGLTVLITLVAVASIVVMGSVRAFENNARQTQVKIDQLKARGLAQAGVLRALWNWYTSNTTVEGSRRWNTVAATTITGTNHRFKSGLTSAGVYLQSNYAYYAPVSHTGITHIKSVGTAQNKTAGGLSLAVTIPAAGVAQGNFLVVYVAMDANAGAVTCADTQGNTYSNAADVTNAANIRTLIFYAIVETALVSGNTVTVSMPATTAKAMTIREFSGPTHLGATPTPTATGNTNAPASGNITRAGRHELLVGGLGMEGPSGDTYTLGAGWTNANKIGNTGGAADSNVTMQSVYRIQNDEAAYSASATNTTSARDWAAAGAGFIGQAHWSGGATRRLRAWRVQNINTTAGNNITVTNMKVSWTGGGAAQLTEIRLNNASVWSGAAATGTDNDVTDTALGGGSSWSGINTYLQWNNSGPADPTTVTVQFTYSGDSATTDAKSHEVVLWDGAHAGGGLPPERTFTVVGTGMVEQTIGGNFKVMESVKAVASGDPSLTSIEIMDWDEEEKNIP
jgi:hypothetical protein